MPGSVMRVLGRLATAMLLVARCVRAASAQVGALEGKVTDSSGTVLIGAILTVDETGLRTTTISR
ncbi:MAG: hypothetical protein ABI910_18090, partial [Gemmatimonadota bacterium]